MKTEPETHSAPAHVRATAWALGQLTLEDTATFNAEMAADPVLASYAKEMLTFCTLLDHQLPAQNQVSTLPENRRTSVIHALSNAATFSRKSNSSKRYWLGFAGTTAAAAALVLSVNSTWLSGTGFGESTPTKIATAPSPSFFPGGPELSAEMLKLEDTGRAKTETKTETSAPLKTTTNSSPDMPKPLFSGTPVPQQDATALPPTAAPSQTGPLLAVTAPLPLDADNLNRVSSDKSYRATTPPELPYAIFPGESERSRDPAFDLSTNPSGSNESYQSLPANRFQAATASPLSTFSIDVDTASYANVRRFLNDGQRPPEAAVRLEELINYFPDENAPPQDEKPFAVRVETTMAPWNLTHHLTRISLKGKDLTAAQRPATNLVFLVDVSGSMNQPNKLPLVQQSLRLLTEHLTENDQVSLVTYAGSTTVVLPSTNGQEKPRILAAIAALRSGGSTHGASGLELAYQQAATHFLKDGVNRVILATDGDFNVGITSHQALVSFIQKKAKTGVFLSVLGYGRGNLKDDTMELLADTGNGHYAYIDSLSEARKTLVEQISGTLVTLAKDVKIQIEFNPSVVKSYRLLGYENRLLAKEDFNNDSKDAGEIGAGHHVTALYELIPVGLSDASPVPVVNDLKYQQIPAVTVPSAPPAAPTSASLSGELMTVKLRWKQPAGDISELLEIPVKNTITPLDQSSSETRWAAAVAGFAQRLRGDATSPFSWEEIRQLARSAKGPDPLGYRGEFLQLIDKAESVAP